MATCPRCKGHLTDTHRCPQRPFRVAVEIILWGLAGGFAGFLLVALFDPHGQMKDVEPAAAVVGGLVAVAVNRLVRA